MKLDLPDNPVPDRVSVSRAIKPGQRDTFAELDGPRDLGYHSAFRSKTIQLPLRRGDNTLIVKLSNEAGSNYGGWAFAFSASTSRGETLQPRAEPVID